MAKTDGKPAADTLGGMFDELKRDGLAWASAEQALLQARVSSGVKTVALVAVIAIGALMVTIAGTIVLANVLVQALAPSLGPVIAGMVVGIALLLLGAGLIVWVKSLLRPPQFKGRAQNTAKVIWSALNEPN